MEIIYQNRKRPALRWDSICRGVVFEWGTRFYMSAAERFGDMVAVDLEDGSMLKLDPTTEVIPVKATVTVEV